MLLFHEIATQPTAARNDDLVSCFYRKDIIRTISEGVRKFV
ncbi:hypothetical protein REIS_0584 [Rickettsia endosymbiont of Ixodes scapularis]|nr:hypothetical protein REIS_0584 [Rickettsia endosymbiont of Ixodes scapularis]